MNVSDLQRKLSLWAVQAKDRKFYDLYKLMVHREWLLHITVPKLRETDWC